MLAAISRDPGRPITQARDVAWAARLVEHCIGTVLRELPTVRGVATLVASHLNERARFGPPPSRR